ncbi:hypothetical protein [Turicimonas muris]|uniref:hypothetical protein n=1 Tax=Turicimonas muris TaxID=1796652 RepID=UPI00260CE7FB|nr:hypothetical protein [Turicimonas muris]
MTTEIMKVVLDCDDEIKPNDQRRFEVQGYMFWVDVYDQTIKDLIDYGDTPVNMDRLLKANAAKQNVLNQNEYDYYDIDLDDEGMIFTIKCRLKNH